MMLIEMRPTAILLLWTSLALPCVRAQELTATLTGRVQDTAGAVVVVASVELRAEGDAERVLRGTTSAIGMFTFQELRPGDYTLTLRANGFKTARVKSIHVADGERKLIPTLELPVSPVPGNIAYFRPLDSEHDMGNLGGAVALYIDPEKTGPPLADVEVVLVRPGDRLCNTTRTDAHGEFTFRDLSPGRYGIRVSNPGSYPESIADYYEVEGGRELVYEPLRLERCHLGNCDLTLRPKRPLIVIE
jgi:hypothetical protein